MNDDYLWDRSGEPDPEVQRLETLLARYRSAVAERSLDFARDDIKTHRSLRTFARPLAAAAILALVAVGIAYALRFHWSSGSPWAITRVTGSAQLDGAVVRPHDRLGVGDALRTGAGAQVTVRIARVGEVDIGPGSELKLLATGRGRHRVSLERGSIHARLYAPPFTFGVRTPAGMATDVGCAFRLEYDRGQGVLQVLSGWVDFDGETLIPAGAVAELREGRGSGSPYYADASDTFRTALRDFDFGAGRSALPAVVANARARDALTLLHLLEKTEASDRALIYDRLSALAPPPPDVTREAVLRRDAEALRTWRKSLGIAGAKSWWLNWKDAF
jgi:ferric-dicitrate binding protein FerR (iron transport regulator)